MTLSSPGAGLPSLDLGGRGVDAPGQGRVARGGHGGWGRAPGRPVSHPHRTEDAAVRREDEPAETERSRGKANAPSSHNRPGPGGKQRETQGAPLNSPGNNSLTRTQGLKLRRKIIDPQR